MDIPKIGGARGIFEIFIPGTFFLINIVLFVYFFPYTENATKVILDACMANAGLVVVIIICFGYLIGILLRLFRTDLLDKISRILLKLIYHRRFKKKVDFKLWLTDEFPYIDWIGEVCKRYLSDDVLKFYKAVWSNTREKVHTKQFFNFCKTMITANDDKAANEVYAAESLTRYISGMFFALALSLILLCSTFVLHWVIYSECMVLLAVVLLCYLIALFEIVRRFRFIRIKEVETVFTASYNLRKKFTSRS